MLGLEQTRNDGVLHPVLENVSFRVYGRSEPYYPTFLAPDATLRVYVTR